MFDVAIIGAGPAGTAAAFDLLEQGLTVLIIDKYQFPRKKACAGGITPKGLNAFAYDISTQIKRTCNCVRITTGQSRSFVIKNSTPLCYMVDRKELDLFSLRMVIQKGAVFKQDRKITIFKAHSDHIEIHTQAQNYKARFLIGADGANSLVRKHFIKQNFYRKQTAIEANVTVEHPGKYLMEFDFSHRFKGYYWIFPKDDHVNIGVYSVDPGKKLTIQMLSDYASKRFGMEKLTDVKGYPICTNGFLYTLDSDRVFLAGDAAGMSEKLLGEGIYFAVKTGRLAAGAIIKSIHTGLDAKNLYSASLKNIQFNLKLHETGARFLYALTPAALKLLSVRFIHSYFAKGYADGRLLDGILFSLVKKNSKM